MKTSRKNEIKKAIMRKPKYGGPKGGRPGTGARVGKARATSSGINYLSRADRSRNYEANGPLTHIPSLGAEINKNKQNRRRRKRRVSFEDRPTGMSQGPKPV